MVTATFNYGMTIGGTSLQGQIVRSAEGLITQEPDLPAAKAGSLTTRTDDDTGSVTLSTGHGIATNDIVDVYWVGGVRYGMTATVTGNVVAVDGGAGTALPAAATAMTMAVQIVVDCDVAGSQLSALAITCLQRCHLHYTTNADASLLAIPIAANEPYTWISGTGPANPLAGGAVGKIKVSNGSTEAAVLRVSMLYESV